ncbi:MAG: hypothetical protein JW787_13050 [Sedimentisphaerales bacterium]|nr:hypothetical protein [Sedimentisphaerales bacterium]
MLNTIDDFDFISKRISNSLLYLDKFVLSATKALSNKKYNEAIGLAELYGSYAWLCHSGIYSCPKIENILLEIAQKIPRRITGLNVGLKDSNTSKRKILHILSQPLQVGGHTRAVERFIKNDSKDGIHSIAITCNSYDIPLWLIESVSLSGGTIYKIDNLYNTFFERATALRAIAHQWADIVILHTHPNDPLPIVAFGTSYGPPVVLFNHADHVFWFGACIADLVADIRPAGQILSLNRRNINASKLLPIPLVTSATTIENVKAKKQLGLDENTTVLLSVANEYKYSPVGEFDFLKIMKGILDKNKMTVLLVVGPQNHKRWAEYNTATKGRIRALGLQNDLRLYWAATDVYVDSLPFASLTSALDVGLLGTPLIGVYNHLSPVLSGDDISLNQCGTHVSSLEEFEVSLNRLIRSETLRKSRGKVISKSILGDHVGHGWRKYIDSMYQEVCTGHSILSVKHRDEELDNDDIMLRYFQEQTGCWNAIRGALSSRIRNCSFDIRHDFLMQNIFRRNIFKEERLPVRVFLGRHTIDKIKKVKQLLT